MRDFEEGDLIQIDTLWYRLGAERKPLLRPAVELESGCQVFLLDNFESRAVARVRNVPRKISISNAHR